MAQLPTHDLESTSTNPAHLSPFDSYRLLISIVVPRPIAWVSSEGADGTPNLAPFSFFNGVGGPPPTVMFSVGRRRGDPKDTLRNVQETGEFVVNIVDEDLAEAMNLTSGDWEYEENEFELAGLATVASELVRPPRVAAAPVAMEAKVSQIIPVKDTVSTMVLGQVVRFHIRAGLLTAEGTVDPARLRPVARLGGSGYTTLGRIFSMARPRRER